MFSLPSCSEAAVCTRRWSDIVIFGLSWHTSSHPHPHPPPPLHPLPKHPPRCIMQSKQRWTLRMCPITGKVGPRILNQGEAGSHLLGIAAGFGQYVDGFQCFQLKECVAQIIMSYLCSLYVVCFYSISIVFIVYLTMSFPPFLYQP